MRSTQSLPASLSVASGFQTYSSPNLTTPATTPASAWQPPRSPLDLLRETHLKHLVSLQSGAANADRRLRPAAAAALDRCSISLEHEIAALDPNTPLDPLATPVEQVLDRAALLEFKNVIRLRAELAECIRLHQDTMLDAMRLALPNACQLPDNALIRLLPDALIERLLRALASVMFDLKKPTHGRVYYPTSAQLYAALQRIQPLWSSWCSSTAETVMAPSTERVRSFRQQENQRNQNFLVELLQADSATRLRKLDALDECQEDALRFSIDHHGPIDPALKPALAELKAHLDTRDLAARSALHDLENLSHAFRSIEPRITHRDARLCAMLIDAPLAARIQKSIASSREAGLTDTFAATRDAVARLHGLGDHAPLARWLEEKRAFTGAFATRYPLAHDFIEALLLKLTHSGARPDTPAQTHLRHYEPALATAIFQLKAQGAPVARARQLLDELRSTLQADKAHWKDTPVQLLLLAAPTQVARLIETLEFAETAMAKLGLKDLPVVILPLVKASYSSTNVRAECARLALEAYLSAPKATRREFEQHVFAPDGKLTPEIKSFAREIKEAPTGESVVASYLRFIDLVRNQLDVTDASAPSTSASAGNNAGITEDAALRQAIDQVESERKSQHKLLPQARSADILIDRFLAVMPAGGSAAKRLQSLERYLARASVIDMLSLVRAVAVLDLSSDLAKEGLTFKKRTAIELGYLSNVSRAVMSPAYASPGYPTLADLRGHFEERVKNLIDTFPNGRTLGDRFTARATLSVSRVSDAVLSYKHRNGKTPLTASDLNIVAQDAEEHYHELNHLLVSVPQINKLLITAWGAMLDFITDNSPPTTRLGKLINDSRQVAYHASQAAVRSLAQQNTTEISQAARSPEVITALNNVVSETYPETMDALNGSVANYCAHLLTLAMVEDLKRRAESTSSTV